MAKDDGKHGAWWWIDRWRRSSAFIDFTLAEQGAYRNLIDELWLRGGVLPNDERILSRASGDPVEWPRLRDKVMSKFVLTPDGWIHKTVDEVMAMSVKLSEKRAAAGRRGFAKVGRVAGGRFTGKHGQTNWQSDRLPDGQPPPIRGRVRIRSPLPDPLPEPKEQQQPAPPAIAVAAADLVERSWNQLAVERWQRYQGEVNKALAARITNALRPLEKRHGWTVVEPLWVAALEDAAGWGEPGTFTPEVFARTFVARMNKHGGGRPRARASPAAQARQDGAETFLRASLKGGANGRPAVDGRDGEIAGELEGPGPDAGHAGAARLGLPPGSRPPDRG